MTSYKVVLKKNNYMWSVGRFLTLCSSLMMLCGVQPSFGMAKMVKTVKEQVVRNKKVIFLFGAAIAAGVISNRLAAAYWSEPRGDVLHTQSDQAACTFKAQAAQVQDDVGQDMRVAGCLLKSAAGRRESDAALAIQTHRSPVLIVPQGPSTVQRYLTATDQQSTPLAPVATSVRAKKGSCVRRASSSVAVANDTVHTYVHDARTTELVKYIACNRARADFGTLVNAPNEFGNSPVWEAVHMIARCGDNGNDHLAILGHLLQAGANPNTTSQDFSPLMLAVAAVEHAVHSHSPSLESLQQAVKLLIEHRAEVGVTYVVHNHVGCPHQNLHLHHSLGCGNLLTTTVQDAARQLPLREYLGTFFGATAS